MFVVSVNDIVFRFFINFFVVKVFSSEVNVIWKSLQEEVSVIGYTLSVIKLTGFSQGLQKYQIFDFDQFWIKFNNLGEDFFLCFVFLGCCFLICRISLSDYKLVLKINYFWVEVKVNIINNIKIVLRKYNIGFSIKIVVIFIFFNI